MLHLGLHWINLEMTEAIFAGTSRLEELADALHFITEFCLLAGIPADVIPGSPERDRLENVLEASRGDPLIFNDFHSNARFTIIASLRLADMLKNKPWKQTIRPPEDFDKFEFNTRINSLWYWFGASVRTAGFTADELFDAYLGKEKENYSRVASGV